MPASETKPAPTSVDAAALAIAIQRNFRTALAELAQAQDKADDLLEMVMSIGFERFNHAVINQANGVRDDLNADFNFLADRQKQLNELLELIQYADRKDG
jgi:hypothetical protein